jgi:small-conductance mechanosensitive channel
MFDRVHRDLQEALDAAGIELPYPTQNLHLYHDSGVNDDYTERSSQR